MRCLSPCFKLLPLKLDSSEQQSPKQPSPTSQTIHLLLSLSPTLTSSNLSTPLYLKKAISYARHGGTVIFAGQFSNFVQRDELNQFFRSHWDLPWEFGDYQRTTVYINPHARLVNKVRFPAAYSQKAAFLKNVPADAALHLPTEDLVTESLGFPSRPVTDRTHMPVAFAAVGEGSLGYVGDTNTEEASYAVIVAMCRL
ncbi:hypothetical protein GX50_04660 [[Emmonsia] crescens]|uniref:Uncharacterized protein n=1 Tax=[Emmonsia] crescens TaxID=73230 RepID=A0A2B7ZG26_9EURO|nr:hypothetical protein GX50_04660 [Emmonsia crescens]